MTVCFFSLPMSQTDDCCARCRKFSDTNDRFYAGISCEKTEGRNQFSAHNRWSELAHCVMEKSTQVTIVHHRWPTQVRSDVLMFDAASGVMMNSTVKQE